MAMHDGAAQAPACCDEQKKPHFANGMDAVLCAGDGTVTGASAEMSSFGGLAVYERPMALRPGLATGLPLSENSA